MKFRGGYRPGPPVVNGWTQFTDTDGTAVYVSNSGGSDSNNGLSSGAPKLTLAAAITVLNGLTNNMPHRLYLKAGDSWPGEDLGQIKVAGRSASEPLLVTAYGAGARPRVMPATDVSGLRLQNSGGGTNGGNNTAVVGIEFYAYTRDPNDPSFVSPVTNTFGIFMLNSTEWMLIEDCKFSFFSLGFSALTGVNKYVTLRRNIVVDCYNIVGTGHSQGAYFADISSLMLEENFFDHNGWNEDVDAPADVFSHNVYIKSYGPAIVRRNISARASSHAFQPRSGGIIEDNLAVANPIGFIFGDTDSPTLFWNNLRCRDNVVLEGGEIDGADRNWGMVLFNCITDGIKVERNIVANQSASSISPNGIEVDNGSQGGSLTDNVIYSWGAGIVETDAAAPYTKTGNKVDLNGDDSEGYAFPAPTRSVGSYFGTQGQTATLAAFLAWHRSRSRGTWTAAYGANAVNNYIRAGFGLPAIAA